MSAAVVEVVGADDPDVAQLRQAMAGEMNALYGRPRHGVPAEAIDPDSVVVTLLVRSGPRAIATASLRRLGHDVEAKRMYVEPGSRCHGLGRRLLAELELRARELGAPRLLLHTGARQKPAIDLYRAMGYSEIDVFEPYLDVPESVCLAKTLPQ